MEFICPYLGLIDDPKTSTVFPDNCNACYAANSPNTVAIQHQRDYCMLEKHTECEGYTSGWSKGFPRELRNKHCRMKQGFFRLSNDKLSLTGMIGIGLLALLLIAGVYLGVAYLQPAPVTTPQDAISAGDIIMATETQAALIALFTPTETPTATVTSTPTLVPTNTPTPDYTPTQTPGPGLSTPFGSPDFLLLVHEIQDQETITAIANQHNTTVDVLWVLNGLAFQTIQVGDPIVVCVGCTDPQGLPQLQAVYLEEPTTLSDLSRQYNAASNDLRQWNGLGEGDWIAGERWVVVPLD